MASQAHVKSLHNFDYEKTKLTFKQEVGYVLLDKKLQNRVLLEKKDVDKVISDIKHNRINYRKYFKENCRIVNENGKDILCQVTIQMNDSKSCYVVEIKQIISLDDLFDVLFELHMLRPHLDELGVLSHFTNCVLFHPFISLFWKSCETCNAMKKHDVYFRLTGEITVFKVSSLDGKFTNIFMYIERNTNFVFLRPLQYVTNNELAYELLAIFADVGSPTYLDSNIFKYPSEYNKVVKAIKSLGPPFKIPIMYMNNRNHKINILATKAKQLLSEWMEKTRSSNWAIGVHVVQWHMNTSHINETYIRSRIVNGPLHSPYHAMFGILPRTDGVRIKEKPQSDLLKTREKVLIDCSQCNLPVYKAFKCYFCQQLCHFSCCVRYIEKNVIRPVLINKCASCANVDVYVDEEVILGT